ncbi:anti-sigma factor antagonist [Streptomyces sp. ME03-5709C]|nr:anti-sigma factor antagonist [Streptomyces sp. ME03-5709C]
MCDRDRHEDGLRERAVDGALVLEVSGEVDVVTAPSPAAWLEAPAVALHPQVVVGLRNVTFTDRSDLSALMPGTAPGHRTRKDCRSSQARGMPRLLRRADPAPAFDLHSDLAGAPAHSRDASSPRGRDGTPW